MASNTQANLRVTCGRLPVSALPGVGTDMGHIDGDALHDAFVTNLEHQARSLSKNLSAGIFKNAIYERGRGEALGPGRLEVVWPNGICDVIHGLDANQILTVVEGEGITGRVLFNQ